ncbi:MAG TPA: hypothetical protein VKR58_11635, partial [Aquella sp.]|nr:hypothetical protein [Aquella sp.]
FPGRDNQFSGTPPPFNGNGRKVYVNGTEPFEFFSHFISDDILIQIVNETNLHAMKSGKNIKLTPKEFKVFLGINIVMTRVRNYMQMHIFIAGMQ